jgi:MFS family permease
MNRADSVSTQALVAEDVRFRASNLYRYYVVSLLLLIAVCNYADRYMLGVLFPLIKGDLNLSDTQMGFISGAAFTITYALVAVPIAGLSDRISRKKIITVAIVIWSRLEARRHRTHCLATISPAKNAPFRSASSGPERRSEFSSAIWRAACWQIASAGA